LNVCETVELGESNSPRFVILKHYNMKKSFLILIFIGICSIGQAQDYDMAAGIRFGYGYGLTFKKVISTKASVEAIGDFRFGTTLTVLYELNQYDLLDVDRLNWYFGAGGHIGSYRGYRRSYVGLKPESVFFIGIDGIIGVEYNLEEAPINVSLDWKPAINLVGDGYTGFFGDSGALRATGFLKLMSRCGNGISTLFSRNLMSIM